MRFVTLTLNPALDMNITVRGMLNTAGLNRAEEASFSPGGKGINVSRALRALGFESDAVCILGGFTGAKVKTMLEKEGVRARVISTTVDTRVNVSVMSLGGEQCEINAARLIDPSVPSGSTAGAAVEFRPAEETSALLYKVRLMLTRLIEQGGEEKTVVILSGSIPPDMPKNTYEMLVTLCRELGAITVCDCDGDALRYALSAHPDYIKPNKEELCALTERHLSSDKIADAATEISITTGGKTAVLLTVGEGGAHLCRGKDYFRQTGVRPTRIRTLKGAGDTFLAAFLTGYYALGLKEKSALQLAAAASAEKIATPHGAYPDLTKLIPSD